MTSANRIPVEDSVNGLRGLALILIVITHYVPSQFFSFNLAKPTAAILFVATGYFLSSVLVRNAEALNAKGFGARARSVLKVLGLRHLRVWPVMAVVVGAYVLLAIADQGPLTGQILQTWPLYLTYLGNMPKVMFEGQAFPAHFWLISAQEQMILLLMTALAMFGLDRLRKMLWWMIPIGLAWRAGWSLALMPQHPAFVLETPLAVADTLGLGLLLGFAVRDHASRTGLRRLSMAGGALVMLLWAVLPNNSASYFSLLPFGVALIGCAIVLTVTDELRAARLQKLFLGSPFLILCGRISLSLFLLHPLVNTLFVLAYPKIFGTLAPWWVLMLVGPPLSLAVAYAFFLGVETPVRRLRAMPWRSASRSRAAEDAEFEPSRLRLT